MNEQELRAELEAEYNDRLKEAYDSFQSEMNEAVTGAMQAIDDYRDQTETKLSKYRKLAARLQMMREQKRLADFKHQQAVEDVMKQISDLESGSIDSGCMTNCCSPPKKAKKPFLGNLSVNPFNHQSYPEKANYPYPDDSYEKMSYGDDCCDGDDCCEAPAVAYKPCSFKSGNAMNKKLKSVKLLAEQTPWGEKCEPGYAGQCEAPATWGDEGYPDCGDDEPKISQR